MDAGFVLGRGITMPFFQAIGKTPFETELLKIIDKGWEITSARTL